MTLKTNRCAVFIDADNASLSQIADTWHVLPTFGNIVLSRAYSDWTSPLRQYLLSALSRFKVEPVQQKSYVAGKNATDIAMVIDVVDTYHRTPFDVAILFSGDSDFTPLVDWLKSRGVSVVGVCTAHASRAFRQSCDVHLDPSRLPAPADTPIENATQEDEDDGLLTLIEKALSYRNQKQRERDVMSLSCLGSLLKQADPCFSVKVYGAKTLKAWVAMPPVASWVKAVPQDSSLVTVTLPSRPARIVPPGCRQQEFIDLVAQVRRNLEKTAFFNGHIGVVEFIERIREIEPDFSPKLYGAKDLLDLIRRTPQAVYLTSRNATLHDVWLHNSVSRDEQYLQSRALILNALHDNIEHYGQSLKIPLRRFHALLYQRDEAFTCMKYGSHSLESLLEKHSDLVKVVQDDQGVFIETQSCQGRLLSVLAHAIGGAVSAEVDAGAKARPMMLGKWMKWLKAAVPGFTPKRFMVANPLAVFMLFPEYFKVKQADLSNPNSWQVYIDFNSEK